MPPEVSVALSTHNGESYLAEQLDSLAAQTYPKLRIDIRDDGSSDGTRRILAAYADAHPNVRVSEGERLGPAGSFFRLLQDSSDSSAYFALCDQDDVWHPDKVERAVAMLAALPQAQPGLYCSRLEYVDRDLAHIGYSALPRRGLLFRNALVENCAVGCTVVLNRAARDLVLQALPGEAIMHDWWCYLVVSAFGTVLYDPAPGVRYRLHGANTVGAAASFPARVAARVRRFAHSPRRAFPIHAQARAFAACFGARLPPDKLSILQRLLASRRSLAARVRYALRPGLYRQSRLDGALLRGLIVLGWY